MINYTKKGTNAENFMQISLLLKKIWYLKDSRNGHFAMHYSSFRILKNRYVIYLPEQYVNVVSIGTHNKSLNLGTIM